MPLSHLINVPKPQRHLLIITHGENIDTMIIYTIYLCLLLINCKQRFLFSNLPQLCFWKSKEAKKLTCIIIISCLLMPCMTDNEIYRI